jgi:hypothetical protein
MVGLTRVCELTIPRWDERDRHCGAKLTIAHLSPTVPQQLGIGASVLYMSPTLCVGVSAAVYLLVLPRNARHALPATPVGGSRVDRAATPYAESP